MTMVEPTMEKEFQLFPSLTDHQLLEQAKTLALRECQVTASLIAVLAELDARKLYLAEGFRRSSPIASTSCT
jgi:hypothetical protein